MSSPRRVDCLCNICICGRHKCPHNPRGVARPDVPCIYSEYHDEYKPHGSNTGRPKDCRPDPTPVKSDAPFDPSTTHKRDYIEHPLGQHYVHKMSPYERPEGEMESLTNYRQHYTPKETSRTQPIRPGQQGGVSARFEGLPTYKADYIPHEVSPIQKHGSDYVYRPTEGQFPDRTSYTDDYKQHAAAQLQPMIRQADTAGGRTDAPLDDVTDYRASYVKHEIPRRQVKEKEQWQPTEARLDDQSSYRRDYVERQAGARTQSFKPTNGPVKSDDRLEDRTTHKDDYIAYEVERRRQRERETYRQPEGQVDSLTTHRVDFTPKSVERTEACRPAQAKNVPATFDSSTQYNTDYKSYGTVDRARPSPRRGYQPMEEKFEGEPTYKRDYVPYEGATPRDSLRPAPTNYSSEDPLGSDTEYKTEYKPRLLPPLCPSDVLLSGRKNPGFTFKHQDELGHRWYEVATNA